MRIERFDENLKDNLKDKLSKVQDKLEDFLSMLETEFDIENQDNFASSSIEYNKGHIRMKLNFVVLADDELKKIAEIKNHLNGCLNAFLIRPSDQYTLECYFGIEHNGKFIDIFNELKMKSDAKKYNL